MFVIRELSFTWETTYAASRPSVGFIISLLFPCKVQDNRASHSRTSVCAHLRPLMHDKFTRVFDKPTARQLTHRVDKRKAHIRMDMRLECRSDPLVCFSRVRQTRNLHNHPDLPHEYFLPVPMYKYHHRGIGRCL